MDFSLNVRILMPYSLFALNEEVALFKKCREIKPVAFNNKPMYLDPIDSVFEFARITNWRRLVIYLAQYGLVPQFRAEHCTSKLFSPLEDCYEGFAEAYENALCNSAGKLSTVLYDSEKIIYLDNFTNDKLPELDNKSFKAAFVRDIVAASRATALYLQLLAVAITNCEVPQSLTNRAFRFEKDSGIDVTEFLGLIGTHSIGGMYDKGVLSAQRDLFLKFSLPIPPANYGKLFNFFASSDKYRAYFLFDDASRLPASTRESKKIDAVEYICDNDAKEKIASKAEEIVLHLFELMLDTTKYDTNLYGIPQEQSNNDNASFVLALRKIAELKAVSICEQCELPRNNSKERGQKGKYCSTSCCSNASKSEN